MATIPYQVLFNGPNYKVILWETLTETNDVGQPYPYAGRFPHKSVQAVGNFGTGGHLKFEGTNEITPANYSVLTKDGTNEIDFTAAGIVEPHENTNKARPHVTAGTGVDLDMYLCLRR